MAAKALSIVFSAWQNKQEGNVEEKKARTIELIQNTGSLGNGLRLIQRIKPKISAAIPDRRVTTTKGGNSITASLINRKPGVNMVVSARISETRLTGFIKKLKLKTFISG